MKNKLTILALAIALGQISLEAKPTEAERVMDLKLTLLGKMAERGIFGVASAIGSIGAAGCAKLLFTDYVIKNFSDWKSCNFNEPYYGRQCRGNFYRTIMFSALSAGLGYYSYNNFKKVAKNNSRFKALNELSKKTNK